jgi:exodeoxyribonuclease VII large subunit
VRVVALKIGEWISRLGEVWVDGQIAQLNRRPGVATQFMTLRDPDANISLSVTCPRGVLGPDITEGSRVVVRGRPDYWIERGSLSLRASEIRQVGLGDLLAQLQKLRERLAAEGLFSPAHKQDLPFLPRTVGLITGRASAAERDVVENARRRLPGTVFRIESVATQGPSASAEVTAAVQLLDRDPLVDVIVIARGGGSVEDLLPFSSEPLLRAVFAARTPVVSAIGHETDTPLLDLVADFAASTPTDAAKQIVPDLAAELTGLDALRGRSRAAVHRRLAREHEFAADLPRRLRRTVRDRFTREQEQTLQLRHRATRRVDSLLHAAAADLSHVRARVRALSPQATLDRGYAVVTSSGGHVVRAPQDAEGTLRVRVAEGEFAARRVDATADKVADDEH